MAKASREKIALVVFLVLVVVFGAALFGYFFTARSWNVAASKVDDTLGQMNGYTVIVYPGTTENDTLWDSLEDIVAPPESESESDLETISNSASELVSESELDPEFDPELEPEFEPGVESDLGPETEPGVEPDLVWGHESEPGSESNSEISSSGDSDQKLYLSAVRSSYEEKGASVLSLNTLDTARYHKPQITEAGGVKVGIYAIDTYTSSKQLAIYQQQLRDQGAQYVLCITPKASLLQSYDHTNIVLVTEDDPELSPYGKNIGDAFLVETPPMGSIGVVIITSTGVVSANVVDSL